MIVAIAFVACDTQSNPIEPSNNTIAKKAVYPAYAGDGDNGTFILWADKTVEAGLVTIDENSITIITNDFSDIRGVHIYAWENESEIPMHRPVPGQAD